LKAVFAKTETHRQSQLVALLVQLSLVSADQPPRAVRSLRPSAINLGANV
jgi:hypothetical protein